MNPKKLHLNACVFDCLLIKALVLQGRSQCLYITFSFSKSHSQKIPSCFPRSLDMFKKQINTKNCDILSRSVSQSGWEASLHWLPLPFFFFCFFLSWLRGVFIALCRVSLIVASRKYSSLHHMGCFLRWLLLWSTDSRACMGFSSCCSWALQLWLTGSRAWSWQNPSRPEIEPVFPAIGKQILIHSATREVPLPFLVSSLSRVWLSYTFKPSNSNLQSRVYIN